MKRKPAVFKFNVRPNVKRKVVIEIPPQKNGNVLEVIPGKLVGRAPAPPKEKNIKLIQRVIEPIVRVKRTKKRVFTFSPPLTVTIYFTAEDARRAREAMGTPETKPPRLSIITSYHDGKRWRWHRLRTRVVCDSRSCNTGKLIVKTLASMHPNDPFDEGSP